MGNKEKSAAYIQQVKEKLPALLPQIQSTVQQILDGTHPAFPR
jgi:hypothetical protein